MLDKILFLCPECAALYAESYEVEAVPGTAAAICECCGKRRMGSKYSVRGKGVWR